MDSHQHHQRALCTSRSQSSVDRDRNDRLGRRQRFEHRRQILRLWSGSNADANIFSDPNRDSHSHGYAHGDCNSNAECYT